jgi:threonine dehydrogenase-like Zn-dependent dehydrogenase
VGSVSAASESVNAEAQVLVTGGPPVFALRTVPFVPTEASCTLEMIGASICASDLHTADGRRPAVSSLPGAECTLGHEGIGKVLAAEAETLRTGVRVGDTVTFGVASSSCSPLCKCCDNGLPQKCTKLYKYGHEAYGVGTELSGTYSTHMVLREGSTIVPISRIGEPLPASLALCCMMNCSGATAVAAVRACGSVVGGRVAVFGGGPLGLLTALRAIDLGAAEVTVIDRNPTVVASVKSFGFTTELTGEYDAVVEACGAKAVLAPAFKVRSACSTPSVSQPFTNTTFSAHASMWLFSASYYPPPPTHPHTHTHTPPPPPLLR